MMNDDAVRSVIRKVFTVTPASTYMSHPSYYYDTLYHTRLCGMMEQKVFFVFRSAVYHNILQRDWYIEVVLR